MSIALSWRFLGSPVWQGVGALVAIAAILITVIFELRRRRSRDRVPQPDALRPRLKVVGVDPAPSSLYYLGTEEGEAEYYYVLAQSIKQAKSIVYRSGRGFTEKPRKTFSKDLIKAEEFALKKGVEIVRIQTADRVSREWAEGYARLAERYPGKLRVYADFKDPLLVNIGLIDPDGPQPEIQMLFESITTASRPSYSADAALSVYGTPKFARTLQAKFNQWTEGLRMLNAEQIRDLARIYLYFAYGSNMSPVQMKQRCPGAQRIGTAIAYGWERNFAVVAPHMGVMAAAAGIQRSDNPAAYIEGVVYDLTAGEKETLDEIESGGYAAAELGFKLSSKHVTGFTHVPVNPSSSTDLKPDADYVKLLIEGAEANGLTNLARQLRQDWSSD
jgi:gamma-glutamylcyclotransferase